jgi:hypothetical protein
MRPGAGGGYICGAGGRHRSIVGVETNGAAGKSILDVAVQEQIQRALDDGSIIRSGPDAARLAKRFPTAGLTAVQISEMLVRAALKAGVATELCQPD